MIRFFTFLFYMLIFHPVVLADSISKFILPSGVEVIIVESEFDEGIFDLEYCSSSDSICRINERVSFGVDLVVPKTYVKNITVSFVGVSYILDSSDMYNAWMGRPMEYPGVIRYFGGKCYDGLNCQFRGIFSDASATFVAEWLIVDGHSLRTLLTHSKDVIDLFVNNMDPPGYE